MPARLTERETKEYNDISSIRDCPRGIDPQIIRMEAFITTVLSKILS
jgi:hypothetical protein